MSNLLDSINAPGDLKLLGGERLEELAGELRSTIIDTVSRTGGHLGANLGAVELTVALLKTFDLPRDKIIWDVSHQTYAYKLLTGRREEFSTLRQHGGICGFLRRSESPYDTFGAGHAGTALSAALGIAVARDLEGGEEHVVAVVGDGAAGCGISFEALNNLASATDRLIVVLNDNEMSIAQNVGSMSKYLGSLLANPRYNRWKRSVESVATRLRLAWLRAAYYAMEEAVKGLFLDSVIFEEFGLRYIGPVDGHDLGALLESLRIARDYEKPIIVHVATRKGKGYSFAEEKPEKWHGTSAFDVATGETDSVSGTPGYSEVFGSVLGTLAERDRRIVAITAAMPAGTGLARFAERFPDRFFDVGISEEHATVFAAGLATQGLVPVFAVYSTFSQRAVDCVIHDVCLQDLPVVLCLDRAGVVGDDGPTHHGVFDLALFRTVPGVTIMQPKDEEEMAHMLYTATRLGSPVILRYPRGSGPGTAIPEEFHELTPGTAEVLREGVDVQFWALGDMIPVACDTAGLLEKTGVSAGVVNARFVKPLDRGLLREHARTCRAVVTVENGVAAGGFGSAVEEALGETGFRGRVIRVGWPDTFVSHGKPDVLREKHGLHPEGILARVLDALAQE